MTERREESLFYQALGYISQVESGFGLYDCLHNGVGMTNAEIEEAGYELEEYYQKDAPEHLAAASNQRYISLEEVERQARKAVEFIIQDGTENTTSGNWILSFEENGFDVTYYLDFCRNLEPEMEPKAVQTDGSRQKLCELLRIPLANVHLVHKEVEIDPATIVELSENTLTDAGKQAWADVLDAEVCRIYAGAYGLQVELAGVESYRLQDFSTMLAGYCSEENYEKWVTAPKETPAQSPEMKL